MYINYQHFQICTHPNDFTVPGLAFIIEMSFAALLFQFSLSIFT